MSAIVLTKENLRTSRPACKRCGSAGNEGFYWATSTATGRLVMMERTTVTIAADKGASLPLDDIHACFKRDAGITDNGGTPVPAPVPAPSGDTDSVPAPAPADVTPAPVKPYVRGENPLADAIRDIVGPVQIDTAEVTRIAREVIGNYVFPVKTHVITGGVTKEIEGLAHERMPRVLAALSARRNVLMVGPAGTGKSHIAWQVSQVLDVPFESMSLTSQTGETKFTGFVDAGGTFHSTEIYDWAKSTDGGVLCLDELDNGNPNILGWMNAVISNRRVRFPNGETVEITPQHYLTATANTYGFGRTREYVGRNPIDAATKNRFCVTTIGIDPALETALVHAEGAASDTSEKILAYVRKLRVNADAKGVNLVMSPRNSTGMAALLAGGYYDWDMAVEDQIQCGIDEITWSKIAA